MSLLHSSRYERVCGDRGVGGVSTLYISYFSTKNVFYGYSVPTTYVFSTENGKKTTTKKIILGSKKSLMWNIWQKCFVVFFLSLTLLTVFALCCYH